MAETIEFELIDISKWPDYDKHLNQVNCSKKLPSKPSVPIPTKNRRLKVKVKQEDDTATIVSDSLTRLGPEIEK